jgi:hypothetical protein
MPTRRTSPNAAARSGFRRLRSLIVGEAGFGTRSIVDNRGHPTAKLSKLAVGWPRSSRAPGRAAQRDLESSGERQDRPVLLTFRPTSNPVLQIRLSQTDDPRFSPRRISLRHRTAPVTGIHKGSSKMHSRFQVRLETSPEYLITLLRIRDWSIWTRVPLSTTCHVLSVTSHTVDTGDNPSCTEPVYA